MGSIVLPGQLSALTPLAWPAACLPSDHSEGSGRQQCSWRSWSCWVSSIARLPQDIQGKTHSHRG